MAERFMDFYQPGKPDDCWPWTGPRDNNNYAVISDDKRRQFRAHRLAYERVNGAIPEGKNVCHRCDNPPCVNPNHLFLGSTADNNEDKRQKGRHSHGETHGHAKLTAADVRAIRARYAVEGGGNKLAADYGVTRDTIYDIVQRRHWKHID